MELKINIPDYSSYNDLKSICENGFEVKTTYIDNQIVISANKAGLISLAKQLLVLAQDNAPVGCPYHYDSNNSLEDDSVSMIIEKI